MRRRCCAIRFREWGDGREPSAVQELRQWGGNMESETPANGTGNPLATLLLVEDDEVQREGIGTLLADNGYRVIPCGTGLQALDAFAHSACDVAVVDLLLPDIDGVALTERLRALDPRLEVIIVTVHPGVRSAVSAMRNGAADFIVKPVESGKLIDSVRDALARRRVGLDERARQQAFVEKMASLENLNTHLNAFSARVAHDLKSPVRATTLWIEFAREALSRGAIAEADGHLGSALRTITSGHQIIDGLLTLSKSDGLPLQQAEVSLEPIIRTVVESCVLEFKPREYQVQVNVAGAVVVDAVLARIALSNVIHNAFKYTSTESRPSIDIQAGPRPNGHYGVTVRDNGIGVPAGQVDRIFQPFERLGSARDFAGEGIGMTTVKRVMDRHGGQVIVHSVEGEGTAIELLFPDQAIPEPGVSQDTPQNRTPS